MVDITKSHPEQKKDKQQQQLSWTIFVVLLHINHILFVLSGPEKEKNGLPHKLRWKYELLRWN